jgi:hypothetical protein
LLHPPSTDHGAVIELLESVDPSPAPSDLPAALDRLRSVLEQAADEPGRVFVYLLSDFREGAASLDDPLPEALGEFADRVTLLAAPPASEPITNVQITSMSAARNVILPGVADASGQITVRLARSGGELDADVSTVRLRGENISGEQTKSVRWQPGQSEASVEFMLDFAVQRDRETGVSARVDADALPADDERHTVLSLRREIRVVLVDRRSFGFEPTIDQLTPGQWIQRALEPSQSSPIELISVEPAALDAADLRTADVVILPRPDLINENAWPLVRAFTDRGGLLMVLPPAESNVHQWTDPFHEAMRPPWQTAREVVEFDDGRPLADEQPRSALLRMISGDLSDLAAPVVVSRVLPIELRNGGGDVLLRLRDGSPLAIAGSSVVEETARGDGGDRRSRRPAPASPRGMTVFLASAPQLDWTNLPSKPLMVPLFHEIIRNGLSIVRAAPPITVGERPALVLSPAARRLVGPDQLTVDFDSFSQPDEPLPRPGLYEIRDDAQQTIGVLAVNVEPTAGRTDAQAESRVKAWLTASGPWSFFVPADAGAALSEATTGSAIAGLLLLIVIALIVLETALAKLFSHAYRSAPGTAAAGIQPTIHDRAAAGHGGGA